MRILGLTIQRTKTREAAIEGLVCATVRATLKSIDARLTNAMNAMLDAHQRMTRIEKQLDAARAELAAKTEAGK
jgi:hypothetical protein